ncbi:MAG: redoxin domain-containing protein [Kineosporiaceae bacterium]
MLALNSPAPALAVQVAGGDPADPSAVGRMPLTDLAGPGGLLVYLMRTTTCPVCAAHVRSLVADRPRFEQAGVQLAVAVPEDAGTALEWATKRRPGAPVVTGVGRSVHEWAGFARKALGTMQQSGTVLLDGAGVVRHVHAATMPVAALDRRGLEQAVAALAV